MGTFSSLEFGGEKKPLQYALKEGGGQGWWCWQQASVVAGTTLVHRVPLTLENSYLRGRTTRNGKTAKQGFTTQLAV